MTDELEIWVANLWVPKRPKRKRVGMPFISPVTTGEVAQSSSVDLAVSEVVETLPTVDVEAVELSAEDRSFVYENEVSA